MRDDLPSRTVSFCGPSVTWLLAPSAGVARLLKRDMAGNARPRAFAAGMAALQENCYTGVTSI